MNVEGKVALVTGGNRGIGAAFVRELLNAGATRAYVGTRVLDAAADVCDECGDRAVPVQLDVTNEEQVAAAADACKDVSILINNAGAFLNATLLKAPDLSMAREEMEVNYFGVLSMCRAFAPVLLRNAPAAIVNVLSAGAIVAVPNMGGYSPSKFAARALTTNIRAELGDAVQVSALIVGSVDTRMAAHVQGLKESPAKIAKAGIKAIHDNLPEVDTDEMAARMRAALERDPERLEKKMAELLHVDVLDTGR
jgi:NAD(P)-dependent dehydrogenase (short-subunit alcohol dehydrogenase family)